MPGVWYYMPRLIHNQASYLKRENPRVAFKVQSSEKTLIIYEICFQGLPRTLLTEIRNITSLVCWLWWGRRRNKKERNQGRKFCCKYFESSFRVIYTIPRSRKYLYICVLYTFGWCVRYTKYATNNGNSVLKIQKVHKKLL